MSKQKQILIETFIASLPPKLLKEATSHKEGRMIFPALLQRADAFNENKRRYPDSVLRREINKFIEGPIAEKRAYGELDHSNEAVINWKNVCLIITEIWWEGDEVWGMVEIFDNPHGQILQEVLKKGYSVGISSRGLGSVTELDEEGHVEVDDDFTLICFDAVTNPSTHGAFLMSKTEKLNENKQSLKEPLSELDQVIADILCQNLGYCECQLKI